MGRTTVFGGVASSKIILTSPGGAHTNWQFGCQEIINNGCDWTPSTALGGFTFTTPIFGISQTGISNTSGLQLFSTSTTCSTSGVIDNACTTAAITLPVAYSDTNYRLSCTGQGPTALPIVQTYTKSNTTFTITIVALTAAVSTFSSYDCTASHN
jgi:hypothetical protein